MHPVLAECVSSIGCLQGVILQVELESAQKLAARFVTGNYNYETGRKNKRKGESKSTHPFWASTQENLSSVFGNNKGVDQPAHPRRLISAFVILLLESIISRFASSEIVIF